MTPEISFESSSKTSGHVNLNNCASGFSKGCLATDDCVKSKQACAKQGTELGSPINSSSLRPIRQKNKACYCEYHGNRGSLSGIC
jgi:hypothetical protein